MMALGLVLHAANGYWVASSAIWPFQDPQEHIVADWVVMVIHCFRMPTFFLLAGFFCVLLVDRRGLVAMLKNRLARVTLPLLVFLPLLVPAVYTAAAFAQARVTMGYREAAGRAWLALMSGDVFVQTTAHLWFLYDLTIFYGVAVAACWVGARWPAPARLARRWFGRMLDSRLRVLWLALPTAVSFWPMSTGTFDTVPQLLPTPRELVAYGIIFGYGWLLYDHRDRLDEFRKGAWSQLVLGAVAFVAWRYAMGLGEGWRPLAVLLSALTTWLWVLASVGLFVRYFGRRSALGRYLSDSSYWVYLVHLPLVLVFAGVAAPWSVSALIKLPAVVVAAGIVCVLTYVAFVRSTFIGRFLNGRRYARRLGEPAATPPSADAPPDRLRSS